MDPGEGLVQRRRRRLLLLLFASSARAQIAHGPVRSAHADHLDAGWVSDHYPLSDGQQFGVTDVHSGGSVHVQGDSRLYFIQDYKAEGWTEHQYTRIDLRQEPLVFTLDLSHVPCGCLACVYMVAMKDPSGSSNNYCGAPPVPPMGHLCRGALCVSRLAAGLMPALICHPLTTDLVACLPPPCRHGGEPRTGLGR